MSRVAIVTDSASDMDPARAASLGISIVPLLVSFGNDTYSAGVDMSREDFWARVTAPNAPIATTAACSPGTFQIAYQKAFDEGAESIVSVHVADALSGTIKAAQVAKAAHANGTTLREEAIRLGFVTATEFDRLVVPEKMTRPA